MTDSVDDAVERARYWHVPMLRAVPAAIVAIIITFSSNHAAEYGLVLFGAFAIVDAVLHGATSLRALRGTDARLGMILQVLVTLVAGITALVFVFAGLSAFIAIVSVWAVITGGLQLAQGIRFRSRLPFARDWSSLGILSLLLALAFLLTPPGYSKHLGGIEQVSGTLDSSIILVGFLGAYLAITAVFDLIAGLSYKWGTGAQRPATSDGVPHA